MTHNPSRKIMVEWWRIVILTWLVVPFISYLSHTWPLNFCTSNMRNVCTNVLPFDCDPMWNFGLQHARLELLDRSRANRKPPPLRRFQPSIWQFQKNCSYIRRTWYAANSRCCQRPSGVWTRSVSAGCTGQHESKWRSSGFKVQKSTPTDAWKSGIHACVTNASDPTNYSPCTAYMPCFAIQPPKVNSAGKFSLSRTNFILKVVQLLKQTAR